MSYQIIESPLKEKLDEIFISIKNKHSPKKSLSLFILNKSTKNIQDFYLKNTSFEPNEYNISIVEIDELVNKKIIRKLNTENDNYSITFKGILILEYSLYNCYGPIENMLDEFNTTYFEDILKISKKKLTGKEKAVLLGLLGLMAISQDYTIKLTENNQYSFKEAVDLSVNFIRMFPEFYDETKDVMWKREIIGETPITAEMRRLNDLTSKTENIYKNDKGYYLQIFNNNFIDEKALKFLLNKIFVDKFLDNKNKEKLKNLLDEIQQKCAPMVFHEPPKFDKLEIRRQIRRIIEDYE